MSFECESRRDIVRATKTTVWTDALRKHTEGCSRCQETVAMTTMMSEIAAGEGPHTLPGYRLIWLKAQFARKQDRLTKFDLFALGGLSLSGIVGLVIFFFWRFPESSATLRSIPAIFSLFLSNIYSLGIPGFVFVAILVTVWILIQDSTFTQR